MSRVGLSLYAMDPSHWYLILRVVRLMALLLFALTVIFFIIHFGPVAPAEQSAASLGLENESAANEKKQEFGLTQPLWRQYTTYLMDMFTLDFGETWSERQIDIAENQTTSDVNTIVSNRSQRTGWLWLWTGLLTFGLVSASSLVMRNRSATSLAASAALAGSIPTFVLALLFETTFASLGQILFGLNWQTFLVDTPIITRPFPVEELGSVDGFLVASKLAIPPALALSIPLAGALTYIWQSSYGRHENAGYVRAARARGLRPEAIALKHVAPNTLLSCSTLLRALIVILIGGTILVEVIFRLEGLGTLLYSSVVRHDYTTLQATFFVFLMVVFAATLVEELFNSLLGHGPVDTSLDDPKENQPSEYRHGYRSLRSRLRPVTLQRGLRSNLRSTPLSAILWVAAGLFLLTLELGSIVQSIQATIPGIYIVSDLPNLLDQRTIPSSGYQTATGEWRGTFLGLSPALAWGFRVLIVYLYATAWFGWLWLGYRMYRDEYRPAPWTTTDTVIARFKEHRGGMIGAFVVSTLLVAAIFAPVIATTPLDQTHAHTSLHGTDSDIDHQGEVTYYDEEAGEVQTTSVRDANFDSASNPQRGVGPFEYDQYGRYHPFGTSSEGTDLLSELLHGLQIYLFVAGGGALLAGLLVVLLSSVTVATRRFRSVNVLIDAVGMLPVLPFVLFASAMFYPRLGSIATQLAVWLALFGLLGGVWLWNVIGPVASRTDIRRLSDLHRAMGMSEERVKLRVAQWGVRPLLAPIVVYAVMSAAGFVITIAALSYLSHFSPVSPYTAYEWGTFIWLGKGARLSKSGHLFIVPTIALVSLSIGMYGVATGLRYSLGVDSNDAVDTNGILTRLGGGG